MGRGKKLDLELGGRAQNSGHSRGKRSLHGCHELGGDSVDGQPVPHARRPPRRRQNRTPLVVAEERQVLGREVPHRAHEGRRVRPHTCAWHHSAAGAPAPVLLRADSAQCNFLAAPALGMHWNADNSVVMACILRNSTDCGNQAILPAVVWQSSVATLSPSVKVLYACRQCKAQALGRHGDDSGSHTSCTVAPSHLIVALSCSCPYQERVSQCLYQVLSACGVFHSLHAQTMPHSVHTTPSDTRIQS